MLESDSAIDYPDHLGKRVRLLSKLRSPELEPRRLGVSPQLWEKRAGEATLEHYVQGLASPEAPCSKILPLPPLPPPPPPLAFFLQGLVA